jgi:hypothetical protein
MTAIVVTIKLRRLNKAELLSSLSSENRTVYNVATVPTAAIAQKKTDSKVTTSDIAAIRLPDLHEYPT